MALRTQLLQCWCVRRLGGRLLNCFEILGSRLIVLGQQRFHIVPVLFEPGGRLSHLLDLQLARRWQSWRVTHSLVHPYMIYPLEHTSCRLSNWVLIILRSTLARYKLILNDT